MAEVEAAAARFVASGRDDDTDFASNLNASKAAFSRTGVVGETDGELAARTSLDVGRDSKFFTLARVVKAAETAVECFSTDLAVFRALPQGMAAARVAFHASAAALARAAFDATATAGSVWAPPSARRSRRSTSRFEPYTRVCSRTASGRPPARSPPSRSMT